MASLVQGTSNGEYDLARSLRLYDTSGDLPRRAQELWAIISGGFARKWRANSGGATPRSPEVQDRFDESKIEQLADKIMPYINNKFEQIERSDWTRQAQDYVARALDAGLTLSTLLVGINAETEAGYVAAAQPVTDEQDLVRLAPHPVRSPGDRDRLFHPSCDHHHTQ